MARPNRELIDWWKPRIATLDPWRELGAHEIDELYAERQTAPYHDLARQLLVITHPAQFKVLLCGARGSGKSTELVRLAREIERDYCVVQTDLGAGLPDSASTLAVVTLLGVAALYALENWSGPDAIPTEMSSRGASKLDGALRRFGDAVPVADLMKAVGGIVTLFAPGTGAAIGATSKVVETSSKGSARLHNALTRGPLGHRLEPEQYEDARAVVEAVNAILIDLEQACGRTPLLLADGLDKRTSVAAVEVALRDEQLLREIRAPLVLTGPVNLRYDPRFRKTPGNFRLSILYNVPTREQVDDGEVRSCNTGIAMLKDLYARRRAAGELADLIPDALVERAAELSSGIVRDFLRLLHAACMNAMSADRQAVLESDLEQSIKTLRLEMQGYLSQGDIDTLRHVLDRRMVPETNNADTLLFENFIACYPNGNLWYRPHELIVDFVMAHSGKS
jgi:hypothetical protein